MIGYSHLKEGWRIFKRSINVRRHGWKKYPGSATEICQQIVKDCWNGKYFQTSLGHFNEFYLRDLGISIEALLHLGYEEEVHKTLEYVLHVFSTNKKICTTITSSGKPLDVFKYAPDSLAFLLYSLRISKANDLVEVYKPFLEAEAEKFASEVIHRETGLINLKSYSSMKDHSSRRSSCYDNCMAAMIKQELASLRIKNPLAKYDYQQLIKLNFWHGTHFDDELYSNVVSGDANVFPYWCRVFSDVGMVMKSIKAIEEQELDKPIPLKYTKSRAGGRKSSIAYLFAPNYEGNTIWLNIGLCYLDLLLLYDKAKLKIHLESIARIIEKNHNFLEVLNQDCTPYKSLFYHADEGMIWAAKFLYLNDKL
ncbi:MAG: hypothetical protein QXK37_01355 [Candidatus Woesearchaeota archaeon]